MKQRKLNRIRILAVLIIILGIFYFYANLFIPRFIPKTLRIGAIRKPTTLLILGTDITFDIKTGEPIEGTDGRTDSILLVRIDPVHYKMNMLSIPRDSFVNVPGYGLQKINAAHVLGGMPLVKQTLQELTGKKIDYYLKVNPYAVIRLVDLLGGVKVYVDKDMYYVDRAQNLNINLKRGWQKLSGKDAQGFVRFRHDALGDLGRIDRQQRFLQAVFQSFTHPTNLLKAPVALEIALKYIQTDLPLSKTIRLVNFTRMVPRGDIRTFTASAEEGESAYAGSILQLNQANLQKIIKEYF